MMYMKIYIRKDEQGIFLALKKGKSVLGHHECANELGSNGGNGHIYNASKGRIE